jgi:hypothetical protein
MKSDKNNGYITLRPMYICDNISLNVFRMGNISITDYREHQIIYLVFNKPLLKCVNFIR